MNKIFIVLILVTCMLSSFGQQFKKYPFKTGKVEYELTGSTTGTQITYWADYGYKEIIIEKSESKLFGQTIVSNSTELILGDDVYEWSDDDDRIYKSSNAIAESWEENNYDDSDIEEFSIELIEALGFEKVGSETLVGKKCDVYSGLGKIWVWKGLTLKTEVKLLGTTSAIIAKSVNTNINVPNSVFAIPKNKEVVTNVNLYEDANDADTSFENNDEIEEIDHEVVKEDVENALKNLFGGK